MHYQTKNIQILSSLFYIILLPIFFISVNVIYITNSNWLYSYGWNRNQIENSTGLSIDQLNSGSDQIKSYFNNDEEYLNLIIIEDGIKYSLYNEKEILHMKDVKHLIKLTQNTIIFSGLFILAYYLVTIFTAKSLRKSIEQIRRSSKISAYSTVGFLAFVGLLASINFTWLFRQFHFISFSNDLWQLNPNTDYLIAMFPQRFFLETTIFIGVLTIIEFIIYMIVLRKI
ncbi:MAG: TIGR01906 family membrane protein [Chloroflexi bacterium]|nr:TIGR01906 family membrane protein [Chloroflexota bacterium]|tara:strand:+ start:5134 stop:5817 length:684 start_codon:yes stop_codon:yes gene_type:complete